EHLLGALGRPDATWVSLRQVHGDVIVEVTRRAGRMIEGDGLWTRDRDVALAVLVADCVPVLFAARSTPAVAAVHAGWKGTRLQIARRMVERLAGAGIPAGDLVVALGPAIGPCCFDIGSEVADALTAAHPGATGAVGQRENGHFFADLWALNQQALIDAGVLPSAIDVVRRCTRCDPTFYSYRRDGAACGRQAAVIAFAGRRVS
ncbi:MAG: peptidoglycan editing factor PgeF, partial [Myxococcota bacterium]